jgi:tyrosine-protein phosphatase
VPDAYPDGPICVYDPHVDLYLEPTAAEAREYDVIFNVASEVLNPFSTQSDAQIPSKSLHTAAEELRIDPNHLQAYGPGHPEYIHIPWEHNTDIVPDLHELVKVVDDRVRNGKRVLVHCQCGVSRSASLVVAYGIYKNPAMTVQQAYDAVKQKSRWIGPNMNLIMQLQEFRSGLIKTSLNGSGNTKASSRVLHSRQATENNSLDLGEPQIPQTAPLPELNNKHIPPQILTQHTEQISPGPSSAPSGTSWQSMLEQAPPVPRPQSLVSNGSSTPTTDGTSTAPSSMHYIEQLQKQTSQQSPPQLSSPQRKLKSLIPIHLDLPASTPAHQALETPRSREFAMTSTKPSDLDETFGITSPRTETFPTVLATDEPLMSPRSEEFAMAPVVPRELDDTVTLGLTSPRTESFFELPHRFSVPSPPRQSMQRPIALQPTSTQADVQAIAELRARMGFTNNRLTMDSQQMKEAPSVSTVTHPDTTMAATNQAHDTVTAPDMDFTDGLMSPRAVEFTANPMREALAAATPETTVTDPRSPPVRGANPITQNIDDVLWVEHGHGRV